LIIIVEGPDGCGKSTLCRGLSDEIGAPIYKPAGTPLKGLSVQESQAEDRGAWGVTFCLPPSVDVIFDRAFPSEFAYGTAFFRDYDDEQVAALDREVATRNHVAIMIMAPEEKPECVDDLDPYNWARVVEAYSLYRHRTHMDWVDVPYHPTVQAVAQQVRARRQGIGPHRRTIQLTR
jgi:hypothetical protein